MKQSILLPLLLSTTLLSLQAQTTFYFHNGLSVGGATIGTGSIFAGKANPIQDTQSEFTISAEAFLDNASTGTIFNGGADGFGINDDPTGDETQRFDNDHGIEKMQFSFNIGGTFQSIDLRYIEETSDEAVLIFDGGSTYQLNTTTALGTGDDFYIGETFTAGQLITLQVSGSAHAGENFSLESFTVVPEAGSFALLTGFCGMAFVMLRRRDRGI